MIKTLTQILDGLDDQQLRLIKPVNSRDIAEGAFGALLTTDPTVNDDVANTAGNGFFGTGSWWFNTATPSVWRCKTGSPAGSAQWFRVDGSPPLPPNSYTLPPAAVYVDGTVNSYLIHTPDMWFPGYPNSWSVNVWFTSNTGFSPGCVASRTDDIEYDFELSVSGGLFTFTYRNGLGTGLSLDWTGTVTESDWNMIWFGYDADTNEMFLSVNGESQIRLAVTFTPMDTATAFRCNVLNYFGGLIHQNDGAYDELAVYGLVPTDDEILAVYNNGDGLYFIDQPCRLFNGCDAWWPFSEPIAPYVDVSSGHVMVAVGTSSEQGGICGLRADRPAAIEGSGIQLTGPSWQPTISTDPNQVKVFAVRFPEQFTQPSPPPATFVDLYNVNGVMWFQDSTGVIYLVGGDPSSPRWKEYDFDYTDWTGATGVFLVESLPAWVCVHALMVSVSDPWTFAGGTTAQVQFAYTNGEEVPTSGTLGGAQIVVSFGTSRPIDTIAILLYNSGPTNNGITIGWDLVLNYANGVGSATGGHLKMWALVSTLPH